MRLKIKLLFDDVKENLYLSLFILVPFILLINQTDIKRILTLLLILIFFGLVLYRYYKKIIIISFIAVSIILIPITINEINYQRNKNKFLNKEFNDAVQIINIDEYDNYQKITFIKDNVRFIGFLRYKSYQENLLIGYKVRLKGKLITPSDHNTEEDFSYRDYLKKQQIVGVIEIENLEIINQNIFFKKGTIKNINLLLNRLIAKNHPYKSKTFLKTLVLGTNDLTSDVKNSLNSLGISHLFVVSGMHFNFLILIIDKILKSKLFRNVKGKKEIKLISLFTYVIITKFAVSITRCFIQNVVKMNNDKLNLGKFNQFSLGFIIAIIVKPFDVFSISFALTYVISGGIILVKMLIEQNRNYISKLIFLTIIVNLMVLPILSNLSGNVNLFVTLFNLIYIPVITYVIFPFSFVTVMIPLFNKIYYFLYLVFTKSIIFINSLILVKRGNFVLPKVPIWFIIIYYVILILFLKSLYQSNLKAKKRKIKWLISIICIIIIWNNYSYFNINDRCTFINVKVGDATIICEKFNRRVILIDTGKSNGIITYLKKRGIKKIDYIIISHPDEDHFGQLNNLIDNFKIKNLIISEYDTKTKEVVSNLKIFILKKGETIKIGSSIIKCLGPLKKYDNTNDNSLVFILKLKKISILFTGDISKKAELDLISKYKIKVDILKVSHHGSKNSSSEEFLNKVEFKKAVAMNGYQNSFGFPAIETVDRFEKGKLYNTIEDGTLTIKMN